ncbi:GNAT family N-acetyltransferase [Chamaesiphon polymorphus]|uniref:GNAT family N-acetyltransferase n=1 Tax=Chamaesiphon polymorphus CCALA 037 TaxID=2107692 RepID=A0A2T1GI50_9CYAN|nr:GNAT family N-acetyltransferase [Chamaesiphon polymorphus]PSB57396.1 GNAT family N-acetyltransferase [Chamaesiphon polymorphus CCALA 037]
MDIQIRLARPEDITALVSLIPESARTLQATYYTSEQIEGALGTVFGVDRQLIEDGTYFVAENAHQIIGCGGWSKRKTLYGGDLGKTAAEDRLLDPSFDSAKIRAFFVRPEWARRGIGSQMMERCEAASLTAGFKTIEIIATLAGEPLYRRFGYNVSEKFEISLPNHSVLPVVRMVKSFAQTYSDKVRDLT